MREMPPGWVLARIDDVTLPFETENPKLRPNAWFNYIDIGCIDNSRQEIGRVKRFRGRDAPSRARRVARAGDILFSTVRTHLRNIALIPSQHDGHLVSTGIALLRPADGIDINYLFRYVCSQEFVDEISRSQDGTLYPAVTESDVKSATIRIPPREEQRRIGRALEGILGRMKVVREELSGVPELLRRYKKLVIVGAFSDNVSAEEAAELFSRIGNRSRALEELRNAVPAHWNVKRLGEIADIQTGLALGKRRARGTALIDVPYLRVANVQRGYLALDEIKTVRATKEEIDLLKLLPGDILMNEGGDRNKLGRGWVWEGQIETCIVQNHVFRVRLRDRSYPAKFVSHYANELGQEYFFSAGTQTTNLASISKSKLADVPVPVAPREEALKIVAKVEDGLTRVQRLEQEYQQARSLLAMEEYAILEKATEGELVPQDLREEPASALLSVIRRG